MGRHHRIDSYIAQMDRLRELRPDIGLSTDLIVGFPTETEEDFEATLRLLDRVRYDTIYAFAYSPRPGTRAAKLPDDVPDAEKNRRLNQLLKHQLGIAAGRYASRVGKTMEVLVEGEAKAQKLAAPVGARVWTGRTSCNRVVNFPADAGRGLIGRFVSVKITGATSLSLQGELEHDAFFAERGEQGA
jgi:tRNA-2-methylthio-N6-dimethylallyladenosine synthase